MYSQVALCKLFLWNQIQLIIFRVIENHIRILKLVFLMFYSLAITCTVLQNQENAMAATFYTQWWLGYWKDAPPDQSAGRLNIYYTYPNRVFAGQNFTVGITLEYVKDQRALLDWVVFSRVSVGLKNISELGEPNLRVYPEDLSVARDNVSRLVIPGEQYSYSLTLSAPQSPGEYVIFPRWNVFYGPGTTVNNNFDWRMENYYNQTDREFGVVEPEDELPAIEVLERSEQKSVDYANLDVFINSPYSSIRPIEILVADIEDSNLKYSNSTNRNGRAFFDVPIDSTYAVTIPGIIDIVPGKIRAVFVNWTDGQAFRSQATDGAINITRMVDVQRDLEVVPIYKTQYFLSVRSNSLQNTNNEKGTGWYDSGDDARFSVDTLGTFLTLQSFDHWNGTILAGESTTTSGTIKMDGPKEIFANWKFDFAYLGLVLGIVTAAITILGKIYARKHAFLSLLPKFSFWKKNDRIT